MWQSIAKFALSLVLLLTACQPAPNDNVIHLTLWQGVNPPPNRDVLQTLVDRFNATHPQIQVESIYAGQGDQQMPKILAAVVGNAQPDLLWFAPTITGQLVELDAIRSIEDWLDRSPLKAEIDPALFESMQWEGHTWSVPFGVNNVGIFYRPSLFEAAGIEDLPRTWDELRQVAKQLTASDRHGILLPLGKGEWSVFMWLSFLWSANGELFDADGHLNLATPSAEAALQLWQDLVQDESAVLSEPERGYELDRFLTGKVAMQLTGPWTLGQLQPTGVDFAVMPIPVGEKPSTSIGGENLFILKTTPDRERAAFTFAEFVLSEEFQTQWAIGTGYLPVNLRSRQSPDYQAFVRQQPALSVFLDQAETGRSRPIAPGYNRISDSLGRAIEAVLLQKQTPSEALANAQRRLNLILGAN
ncbi:ABC transporter substrate-binding protein [Microcoleus sp. FACHB-1515]|uniref:ABC transporter substrate-binding protein n=1 Tax=Cyanophyceae TaxID=3028117 RepID=UPI001683A31C|nr:ABC transporter substrate-binding protein [Microcoleus sp. FACHB-1515]MBD2091470.1 ABC transporter substrate-binding protein [Microcoleus sp. FACHB-1515]